jgi:excisionase family DNA binding protein
LSKNYKAEEVAKKFNVSTGHIYELIKRGEIQKIPNLGRTIRIASSELKKIQGKNKKLKYLSEKIEVVHTFLGDIRKIRNEDWYLILDLCKCIGIANSGTIKKAVKEYQTKVISQKDSIALGLPSRTPGLLFINYEGFKNYLLYSCKAIIDKPKFLSEISWQKEESTMSTHIKVNEIIYTDLTPIEIALGVDSEGNTTARKLYEFLQLDFKNYARWTKSKIEENEFAIENTDYIPFLINDERNPKPTTDYKLIASFAKKLAMGTHNKRGEQAKTYFVAIEENVKQKILRRSAPQAPDNYFVSFSEETRNKMIADLEDKNSELFIRKEKIDKTLLNNIDVIQRIKESLNL